VGLGRCLAVGLVGLQGHIVEVEADITAGLPAFSLVGLPDTALAEARDRVRAASANSGCPLPAHRITVNLSPASLPKTGTAFDLAVAAALQAAAGRVPAGSVAEHVHLGELGLDGRVHRVRGVLPSVIAAAEAGCRAVVVPAGNESEARLVPGIAVVPVTQLADVVALHRGEPFPAPPPEPDAEALVDPRAGDGAARQGRETPDLRDVAGQAEARHAIEVAAAGGHHLLLLGPPGAGKTMLAARLPGLLPDLDDLQALEVTAVHSVSGLLPPDGGLLRRPPFEDPHHTATIAAIVGGG
jgi:magnesium chelatase family protein